MTVQSIAFRNLAIIAFTCMALPCLSRAGSREVIFLKNGSVIKGDVIEQVPDESLKMRTIDGSIFVYKMEEIEKISKEEIPDPKPAAATQPGNAYPGQADASPSLTLASATGGMNFWGGISFPFGKYGDGSDDGDGSSKDGFAKKGFAGGLQFYFPAFGVPGLLWATDAAFVVNGFDGSHYESSRYESFDAPTYIHIPLLSGAMFQVAVNPNVSFFGLGQMGVNFLLPSSAEYRYYDPSYLEDTEMSKTDISGATTMAFSVGAGIRFNRVISVGFRFLDLGEPKLDLKRTNDLGSTTKATIKKPVSMGLLTIGMGF